LINIWGPYRQLKIGVLQKSVFLRKSAFFCEKYLKLAFCKNRHFCQNQRFSKNRRFSQKSAFFCEKYLALLQKKFENWMVAEIPAKIG
jgi:hypothetical protein